MLIGYLGSLAGYTYVYEVMTDPLFEQAVAKLMDEVTPTLQPVPGIDLDDYKNTLIERILHRSIQAFDRSITHLALTGKNPYFPGTSFCDFEIFSRVET
jgi:mannitol-1-phosphate/altronate dehydrogenase